MRTDSGTEEDNIYHVLFTWLLDKYGQHVYVTNVLNSTSNQNPSTQKCSSPYFLTVGYFQVLLKIFLQYDCISRLAMRTTKWYEDCKTSKMLPYFRISLTKHNSDPMKIWDEREHWIVISLHLPCNSQNLNQKATITDNLRHVVLK